MSAAEGFIEKITFKWSLEGCVETILKEEGIRKEVELIMNRRDCTHKNTVYDG